MDDLIRYDLAWLCTTAVPGVPLVQAAGKSASGKPATASLMHTMARLTSESWIACHARSADVCGVGMLVAVSELRAWLAGASCDDDWSGALEAGFSPVQH